MSTGKSKINVEDYLLGIPSQFRSRIIKEYLNIKSRFKRAEFDSSGLSGGKFCEENLRFLQNALTGSHIGFKEEIKNFQGEILKLEKIDKSVGNDSLRIIIPRALSVLYTFRNKRNIGHSGGDVEANQIDSLLINQLSDWVICEYIRIYHNVSLEEAQDIIDLISTRSIPLIWEVNGKKRVLNKDISAKDKVLLLLYSEEEKGVLFEDLLDWIEYKNVSDFRTKVLAPLHREGMIEYDREIQIVIISPKGIKKVEDTLLAISV